MKNFAEDLLVRTLAVQQAPWPPIRRHWESAPAIHARRRGEVPTGIAANDGNRMRLSREREDLQSRGLLTGLAMLTPEGKRLARALVWPFDAAELAMGVDRLTAAIGGGDYVDYRGHAMVPEQLICGEWWGDQVALLQQLFLPLLSDGEILSFSETDGRAYYAPGSDANLSAVVDAIAEPGVEFSETLAKVYEAEYKRCRHQMLDDRDYWSELGELPVPPMSLVSKHSHRDLSGIAPLFDVEAEVDG